MVEIRNIWEEAKRSLRKAGFVGYPDRVSIHVDRARLLLARGLQYCCNGREAWLPEYNSIVKWLEDNQGRGLWLCGDCGRGKTLIGASIIPLILANFHNPRKIVSLYDAKDLNTCYAEIAEKHIIYIDDVGKESVAVQYGNRDLRFADIVDLAEKKGKLLMFSTNLSQEEMLAKYGERTVDRLRAITTKIVFKGESMRR